MGRGVSKRRLNQVFIHQSQRLYGKLPVVNSAPGETMGTVLSPLAAGLKQAKEKSRS